MSMLFPSGIIPQGPSIQPGKALLLLDFQNDFVSPEGKLSVKSASSFLPKLSTLANKFRSEGTVIWCRTEYTQPQRTFVPELGANGIILKQAIQGPEGGATNATGGTHRRRRSSSQQPSTQATPPNPEAFLAVTTLPENSRPCLPGTWGSEYPVDISNAIDRTNDIDVVKSNYSAFADSTLLISLRMNLITHIYVCGSLSNISVYASVLDAVRHGIQVTLIEDLLGYITESSHIDAIRQMVDNMGAGGIDYSELMDDLAGLLGDVIHEDDYSTRYQVSIPSAPPRQSLSLIQGQEELPSALSSERKTQSVEEWRAKIWPDERKLTETKHVESDRPTAKPKRESPCTGDESSRSRKSTKISSRHNSPDFSPPNKRSTSDLDDTVEDNPTSAKSAWRDLSRPSPSHTRSAEGTRHRAQKLRVRRARPSQESSSRPKTPTPLDAAVTQSTGDLPNATTDTMPPDTTAFETSPASTTTASPPQPRNTRRMKRPKSNISPLLDPSTHPVGAGDTCLHTSILSPTLALTSFTSLRDQVKWATMQHRTGSVPRLVAVQGQSLPSGDIPIYRHPADESPALLPFSCTVTTLKEAAEKVVGHELNHVLIQYYRSGEDNISEHSDKTLDIARGSKIVNFSLGARRTMTLRTKRSELEQARGVKEEEKAGTAGPKRETQRFHLPHNSVFVLGEETNRYWLHAIRADKRPESERDEEEKAFGGERISLTFRHIGTFINSEEQTIWGQGATGKTREQAKKILEGREAESEGEKMIIGFGRENHLSESWNWEETYGEGFDVVNFETREAGV